MPQLLTLFGNPVTHSLSPRIHQHFAKQFELEIEYSLTTVSLGGLKEALEAFALKGGVGANVTIPCKEEAFSLCHTLSKRALRAQAVNTLIYSGATIEGDNTDGEGFIQDFVVNQDHALKKQRILIVGAGGATRGILGPIIDQQPEQIVIVNRTREKAERIIHDFQSPLLQIGDFDSTDHLASYDVVIQAAPFDTESALPSACVAGALCYDLAYDLDRQTPFMTWCLKHGALRVSDGLGMLVEQAALSFELWFGSKPKTDQTFKLLGRHTYM